MPRAVAQKVRGRRCERSGNRTFAGIYGERYRSVFQFQYQKVLLGRLHRHQDPVNTSRFYVHRDLDFFTHHELVNCKKKKWRFSLSR